MPIGLLHAATSVPNHLASELQDLYPPVGVSLDLAIEDGGFTLGDSPGLGIQVDEEAIAAHSRPVDVSASNGPNVRPERAGQRLLAAASEMIQPGATRAY
jgi:hypothetical protein